MLVLMWKLMTQLQIIHLQYILVDSISHGDSSYLCLEDDEISFFVSRRCWDMQSVRHTVRSSVTVYGGTRICYIHTM
jgi:hypothetical protein